MDSCDRIFKEINDLKLKIKSSKQITKNHLESKNLTPDEISQQIKSTTERLKMYRKMKNLQKKKEILETERTNKTTQQKQYEVTFKVVNKPKKTEKHTYFAQRNLDEVFIALDTFDEFI